MGQIDLFGAAPGEPNPGNETCRQCGASRFATMNSSQLLTHNLRVATEAKRRRGAPSQKTAWDRYLDHWAGVRSLTASGRKRRK